MPRKRRPSSITKLPPELRAELDRLLADGKYTLQAVTDHLRQLGANVSWSGVQRYSADFERMAQDMRLTREMARAIGQELDAVEGDAGRLVIESLQALLLRTRMQVAKGEEIDPAELAQLTRAARDLQSALKLNVDTEIKVRERALREAAEAAEDVGKSEGLTGATIDAIKAKILGIRKE